MATDRDPWFRWHWQNLNERAGDRHNATGNPLRHGRAWFYFGRACLGIEWIFGKATCSVGLDFDGSDNEVGGNLCVPLAGIYWHLSGPIANWVLRLLGVDYASCQARVARENARGGRVRYAYQDSHRVIGLRVFDWAIWWSFWERWGEWSSSDPWWMHGNWHPIDTFLGRRQFSSEPIETRAVVVPMPEAQYAATAEVTRDTWTRPRWPWWPSKLVLQRVKIEVPEGIPIPGKGENSWDCGPDATYSSSGPARSIEEAIGKLVASSLETRKRRGARPDYSERSTPRPPTPAPAAEQA